MANRISPKRSLYSRVMAFPVGKKKKFVVKAPKAKGGGGGGEAEVIEGGKGKQRLRWFEVALSADAGASSSHKEVFYHHHLKKLSKSQLGRLRRRIERIRHAYLDDKKTKEVMGALLHRTEEAIYQQTLESEARRLRLKEQILSRLRKEGKLKFEKANGKITAVILQGARIPFDRFIRTYFSPIIHRYNALVDEGEILPTRGRMLGLSFVKACIQDYFSHLAEERAS